MFCREITDISILKAFIHLRYIDLSGNKLKDISSLSVLTHLLTLKADNNLLTTAKLEEMPFLQIASFNKNKIKSLDGVNHPMLEHLSLNGKLCILREITLYIEPKYPHIPIHELWKKRRKQKREKNLLVLYLKVHF